MRYRDWRVNITQTYHRKGENNVQDSKFYDREYFIFQRMERGNFVEPGQRGCGNNMSLGHGCIYIVVAGMGCRRVRATSRETQ